MTTTPTHLDPFHRPPHGALTTRFEVNYLCSLCDNQIELSDTIYFSDYAQDFDELWQKFQNHIDDPMNLAELLLPAVRSHHHDQPLPEPVPVELTYARHEHITEYYCIDCNRPFETIGSLRIHMGCNPVTNHSIYHAHVHRAETPRASHRPGTGGTAAGRGTPAPPRATPQRGERGTTGLPGIPRPLTPAQRQRPIGPQPRPI